MTDDMYKLCEQEAECIVFTIDNQDGTYEVKRGNLYAWFPEFLIKTKDEIRLAKLNKILKNEH